MTAPGVIRKLDEAVVNRIAAGEVIQRPANALKELLENSLDAGATSISVLAGQGGLALLQITDNGSGIRQEDLGIVCERFTTSKLREFNDLTKIQTFGFRGEALASVSHVAKLTILTKTKDSPCGFKASYSDGKPVEPKPKPCAANQGTQITVEDLFFNVPTRLRVLKSPSDEFNRISDVVTKYAIHNSGVAFNLKRSEGGSSSSISSGEVRTQASSDFRCNVGVLYGSAVAKELIQFELDETESPLKFKAKGWVTNANYNAKKFTLLLFINNRLVDSSALRRAIDMVYSAYLPKGTHPFVYMSLSIAPSHVDVNVHPTKHEVHFLNQDEIVERIQRGLDAKLLGSNASRTFKTQALLPGAPPPGNVFPAEEEAKNPTDGVPSNPSKAALAASEAPKNMVRTDARDQKLDKFLAPKPTENPKISASKSNEPDMEDTRGPESTAEKNLPSSKVSSREKDKEQVANRRVCKLASLGRMRQRLEERQHSGLRDLIANHTFVGCVDRQFSLLQHGTKLYLANNCVLSEAFFYQVALEDFANFEAFRLGPAPHVRQLAMIALDSDESGWTEADGDKSELADFMTQMLVSKRQLLDDYFSLEIDEDGLLHTVPLLLQDFVPFFGKLPMFLMRLATEVNWDEEEDCLDGICQEIARFCCVSTDTRSQYDVIQHIKEAGTENGENRWKRVFENIMYPAFKKKLSPSKICAEDYTFAQIANLPDLYKVFERC